MLDIQSIIDRLENIDANLKNPSIPAEIHLEAFKSIIPEIIEDLKSKNDSSFTILMNQRFFSKSEVEKAWDLWIEEYNKNPSDFLSLDNNEATGKTSLEGLIYYIDKSTSGEIEE